MTCTNPAIPTEGGRDRETVSWWVEVIPGNQVTSQGSSGKDIDIESELVLVMYSNNQKHAKLARKLLQCNNLTVKQAVLRLFLWKLVVNQLSEHLVGMDMTGLHHHLWNPILEQLVILLMTVHYYFTATMVELSCILCNIPSSRKCLKHAWLPVSTVDQKELWVVQKFTLKRYYNVLYVEDLHPTQD